jgi:hypothetical protein
MATYIISMPYNMPKRMFFLSLVAISCLRAYRIVVSFHFHFWLWLWILFVIAHVVYIQYYKHCYIREELRTLVQLFGKRV